MLGTINIGTSALLGFSAGLRVIANNVANLNTPGFKGSSLQFANVVARREQGGGSRTMQVGYGLDTAGSSINFRQGELRQTGNELDLAVDGEGLFTLRDPAGDLHYTRAGQFQFGADGVLVNRADGMKVMGRDANGTLTEINISSSMSKAGKATAIVQFSGNLSSSATDANVGPVTVFDSLGAQHSLNVKLTNTGSTLAGSWRVELFDGQTSVGTGQIVFAGGLPQGGSSSVSVSYNPGNGVPAVPLTLDFGTGVTSVASGVQSNLVVGQQDGYASGSLTAASFDAQGKLVLKYSNGQTSEGSRLVLGRFDSPDAVASASGNRFEATDKLAWHIGVAGDASFGEVRSGMIEMSNVDLSQEFSELVIVQRGYQAASQITSSANELLEQLFQMSRN